ncbi:M20 family metallopeptidase [Ornithinibacillus sp. 4-3]|uniref:Peptidase M20 domain-containing protein 2 n=1 Tax=Ornithinibacillus sp. 4-3 TaxID=3231488 RepID=A0AB39HPE9_9BACI
MKSLLQEEFNKVKEDLIGISDHLYHHPELGDQEFESSKLLVNYLKQHDFEVETGLVERPTSFKAVFKGEKTGPTIAYLAEYDALPGVGHGCGHNLIGTMAVGAGVVLSKLVSEIGGTVTVYGTPAEETNGAKVPMAKAGLFNDVDVAMMLHPSGGNFESGSSLAMDALQFDYTGQTSHAAGSPEKGINALDAVIQLFNGINAIREHLKDDARVHGIITNGGEAANVVPDKATAQFYVRAQEREYLDEVVEKVKAIAHGAAMMTGTKLEISNYELSYDNMVTNQALSSAFSKNLKEYNDHPIRPKESGGSLDMGDVSQVVPSIHPYIGLNKPDLIGHTTEFADQTITEDGHNALMSGVLAMAATGYDVITNEELLKTIKEEFKNK